MHLIGIDTGSRMSALVHVEQRDGQNAKSLHLSYWMDNETVRRNLERLLLELKAAGQQWTVVIEDCTATGIPFGNEIHDTLIAIGRFAQVAHMAACAGSYVVMLPRRRVRALLGTSNDAGVRQAVLAAWPATGGGSVPQVGTKKLRGPLYGVKSHIWQALGLLVAYELHLLYERGANTRS